MGPYRIIENINKKNIFKYSIICVLFLFFFQRKHIGLNIIFALGLAFIVISFYYERTETLKNEEEHRDTIKKESIKPKPQEFSEYKDIIDLLFSIQDLHHYNPEAFEEMVDDLDSFFKIYKIVNIGNPYCEYHYQIADSKKNNALNSLHSLVYNMPDSDIMIDKLNRAHKRMETLLNRYLNEIYDECYSDLIKKGYFVNRKQITLGPKEYNHYYDKDYMYQLY